MHVRREVACTVAFVDCIDVRFEQRARFDSILRRAGRALRCCRSVPGNTRNDRKEREDLPPERESFRPHKSLERIAAVC